MWNEEKCYNMGGKGKYYRFAGEKMPQQEVAFLEECRKIKGFGSLREDFYTKFKPEN